jgi:hypothetical protein
MAKENPNSPEQELFDRLFGDITQLNDEELDALYESVAPPHPAREQIRRIAEQAAVGYRLHQQLPPEHVQTALDATRTQTTLEGTTKSSLKRIVEALKPPVRGPVGDPSFAFQKKKDLTEADRQILERQVGELAQDWGETDEE